MALTFILSPSVDAIGIYDATTLNKLSIASSKAVIASSSGPDPPLTANTDAALPIASAILEAVSSVTVSGSAVSDESVVATEVTSDAAIFFLLRAEATLAINV